MTYLRAKNLTLVHPIFDRGGGQVEDSEVDARFVRGERGQLLGVKALDRVSIDLGKGSRVGLVGRNGSGKTTLLRTLAGIIVPNEGQVEVEGRASNLININLGSKGDASGHRNITLMGLAHGYSRSEIEARRPAIEEFSELGDFLSLPVSTYSAGMRMRLSFAVATAFDPEILLLDEWLSAGDEKFKRKAAQRMAAFVEDAGILLLASHSRPLLEKNCDRIIWLENGRIREDGDVCAVLDAYQASFN